MISRKHIVICTSVLCILLMGSCRPRGILSSGEMRSVLVDLHKADGMMQAAGFSYRDREAKTVYYAQVLKKHGITQAQFDSSLVWYTSHPQLFNKIYPKVLADLQEEENRYIAMIAAQSGEEQQSAVPSIANLQIHVQLDTTIWEMGRGHYPVLRPKYRKFVMPDSLMHDSVNQFFPQVILLR